MAMSGEAGKDRVRQDVADPERSSQAQGVDGPMTTAFGTNDSGQGSGGAGGSSHNGSSDSMILRIKRKRGADPITALRIETLVSKGLDPRLAEQRARSELSPSSPTSDNAIGTSPEQGARANGVKRQMMERGIFRLAETVSLSSFESVEQAQELQDRIRQQINKKGTAQQLQAPADGDAEASRQERGSSSSANIHIPTSQQRGPINTPRFRVVNGTEPKHTHPSRAVKARATQGRASPVGLKSKHTTKGARGVSRLSNTTERSSSGRSTPRSIRQRPQNALRSMRMIDAVIDSDVKYKVRKQRLHSRKQGREGNVVSPDVEMAALDRRFADLLGDFLREQDLEPPSDLSEATATAHASAADPSEAEGDSDSSDDYVYDIYYRVRDPFWGSSPAGASDAGLRPAEVAGRGSSRSVAVSTGPIADPQAEPMATLVGLTERDFFNDDSEETQAEIEEGSKLVAEELMDSDDPFDEGEDEDSNDEDFYRNDYPEDDAGEDDEEGATAGSYEKFGWSGPRRRLHQSALYDSDESEGSESDD